MNEITSMSEITVYGCSSGVSGSGVSSSVTGFVFGQNLHARAASAAAVAVETADSTSAAVAGPSKVSRRLALLRRFVRRTRIFPAKVIFSVNIRLAFTSETFHLRY